jgi:hypothetical protein
MRKVTCLTYLGRAYLDFRVLRDDLAVGERKIARKMIDESTIVKIACDLGDG